MLTAIVGTNWGDEGKGRMVDLLSEDYDVVVRYQGGNNAGHTVINEKGKFFSVSVPTYLLFIKIISLLFNIFITWKTAYLASILAQFFRAVPTFIKIFINLFTASSELLIPCSAILTIF